MLLLAVVVTPASAAPDIQAWTTDNGARVLFIEAREIPLVEAQVTFAAGAARDGEHPGIAHLVSDLLMSGTTKRDADALATALERDGAEVSTGAARDMGWVEFRSLSADELLWPVADTVAGMLARPAFPAGEIQRLKDLRRTELENERQSPGALASRAFWEALYGDHPYGHLPLGSEESLAAIGRADLQAFHDRYYVARNANIAIVGDLDRRSAERLARTLVQSLPAGEPAAELPPPPDPGEARTIERAFPSTQAHVTLGHVGVARGFAQWPALYVANHVLGGGGFTSRLMTEVREKRGLVYGIGSRFSPMAVPGPFRVTLQTRGDQAGRALEIVRSEIERFIEDGPTEAELEDAKRNIVGGFPLQIDSNAELAGYIAMIGFYDLPLDYLDRFRERAQAVDREAARQAVKTVMADVPLITVIVGGDRAEGGS
ncbi:MAG: pitrilysin family protein [Halofilum sp. (in: g-proteobacteria)]|nr:pitrilysin family protein [Halofilum sp. (in: g-proteobacteria)]